MGRPPLLSVSNQLASHQKLSYMHYMHYLHGDSPLKNIIDQEFELAVSFSLLSGISDVPTKKKTHTISSVDQLNGAT